MEFNSIEETIIKYRITKPEYVENPFGFKLNENNLFFDKKEIMVIANSKIVERIPFSEFLRYPHAKFRQIQEICNKK